jgi:hypothetical protein
MNDRFVVSLRRLAALAALVVVPVAVVPANATARPVEPSLRVIAGSSSVTVQRAEVIRSCP